jgi:hypothetical protein
MNNFLVVSALCLISFAVGAVSVQKTKPESCTRVLSLEDSIYFIIDLQSSVVSHALNKVEAKAVADEVYTSYGVAPLVIRGYEIVLEEEEEK